MDKKIINAAAARLRRIAAGWPPLTVEQARALHVIAQDLEQETGRFTPRPLPKIGHVQPR